MDILTLSRIQFGGTAAFHILWPLLSIGLGLYLFVLEAMWLKTKNDAYYRQLRFWVKIFVLTFVMGTASGIPLEFEFGTNWAAFSNAAGDFFGNILGFESTVAFALEAAFLGIFAFGWKRVRPGVHLFANAMVAFGATLSAFWIMVANSWMQIPTGITVEGTKIIVTDYMVAIFNPGSLISFAHMEVASIETTLFFIMGISAAAILFAKDEVRKKFFLQSFRIALAIAVIVTPLQLFLGDVSGQEVAKYQPEKLAALEMHWDTNPAGTGAGYSLLAWPSMEGGHNTFDVQIPNGLSLITTHSMTGQVKGLNEYRPEDRPTPINSILTFYSFRLMVLCGITMFLLMLAGMLYWKKGWLSSESVQNHRAFWWLWVIAIPTGFVATEAGWMVREIGRQPWVVYHLLRTSQGISPNLSVAPVFTTTILFGLFYFVAIAGFIYFTHRIVRKGPDLTSPVLRYVPRAKKEKLETTL
ncbi:MAG: cytochrome bd ubiquinol oxidase, subunit [Parcubacteria group bacterium]|nr:cytochrome bd ubiquinol oxidase, subunit [Parcubacteria group bacterium]